MSGTFKSRWMRWIQCLDRFCYLVCNFIIKFIQKLIFSTITKKTAKLSSCFSVARDIFCLNIKGKIKVQWIDLDSCYCALKCQIFEKIKNYFIDDGFSKIFVKLKKFTFKRKNINDSNTDIMHIVRFIQKRWIKWSNTYGTGKVIAFYDFVFYMVYTI